MANRGLGDWIHRRKFKSAGRPVIYSADYTLTYDELATRIDQFAQALRERGVKQGDRVAYLGENHPSFLESMFAITRLGAIFVPLNTRLSAPELNFQLKDSGSTLLIASQHLLQAAQESAVDSPVTRLIVVERHGYSYDNVDEGTPALPQETYDAVIDAAAGADTIDDVTVALEDTAMILYTSGTTGAPKGAVLSHGNMTWSSYNVISDLDITSKEISLMISPLFHVAALGQGALPILLKGGALILEEKFLPEIALKRIGDYKVTAVSGVPTTFQFLADDPAWPTAELSTLRVLTCGGSAMPQRVLDAYEDRGIKFTMSYGMTEAGPGVSVLPEAYSRSKSGSAGLPQFHIKLRIVDPLGQRVDANVPGEIQVSGNNVIQEYWNRPEANEKSFITDEGERWFATGDMGYLDEDGFLFITDRIKDMIISGGENVYPAQVEQEIAQLPGVTGVAVIGVPDEKWGEVPRAIISVREGHTLDEKAVITHLKERLANYKVPKSIVLVEELPRTASGKVKKPELRQKYGTVLQS